MSEENKTGLMVCVTVFAVITSIAWAIAVVNLYGPNHPPLNAKDYCARQVTISAFCLEIARER